MDDRQAAGHAWQRVRSAVGTENWTVGESATYYGFFLNGWSAAKCWAEHMAGETQRLADESEAQRRRIAELERDLDQSQRQVIALMICVAINGSDWIAERLDADEKPAWAEAVQIVRDMAQQRDIARQRIEELERIAIRHNNRIVNLHNAIREAIEDDTYCGMQGMIATDLQQALDADIMSCTKPLESPT